MLQEVMTPFNPDGSEPCSLQGFDQLLSGQTR
jgi:hypothetical protein